MELPLIADVTGPCLWVRPTELDLGRVPVDATRQAPVTVASCGPQPVRVDASGWAPVTAVPVRWEGIVDACPGSTGRPAQPPLRSSSQSSMASPSKTARRVTLRPASRAGSQTRSSAHMRS